MSEAIDLIETLSNLPVTLEVLTVSLIKSNNLNGLNLSLMVNIE